MKDLPLRILVALFTIVIALGFTGLIVQGTAGTILVMPMLLFMLAMIVLIIIGGVAYVITGKDIVAPWLDKLL